jgi:hypothetical protein
MCREIKTLASVLDSGYLSRNPRDISSIQSSATQSQQILKRLAYQLDALHVAHDTDGCKMGSSSAIP